MFCPLCYGEVSPRQFIEAFGRIFFKCDTCQLLFVTADHFLSQEEEYRRYQTHRNDPADERYQDFLSRLLDPLLKVLPPQSTGLDYGSGPGPAIKPMLAAHGHTVANYDPFFAPDLALLEQTYDFICCSETSEHFHRPREEFERLFRLLRTGGVLAIMTSFYDMASAELEQWYYLRDPTHVCVYSSETFRWLAQHFSIGLQIPRDNVAIFGASLPR